MIIPEGFEDEGEDTLICKAIYGTKQAGNLWGAYLHDTLTKEGAKRSAGDRCLYLMEVDSRTVYVEVHVDDLLIASSELDAVEHVKQRMASHFRVRDMGQVVSYLGMEISWNKEAETVTMANPRNSLDLLREFNMEDCKPVGAPMARGAKLGEGVPLGEDNLYAELVGSLLYLCNQTRHDISFAVGRLARRMVKPTEGDWRAAKTFLRYLKGFHDMGLTYGDANDLEGWADADFAGDRESRKSTTGFVFTLHGGAVSWRSRLQRLVTTLTATAEYVTAAEATKDSLWLRRIVGSLGEEAGPVVLHEDNQACIVMARNEG